MLYENIRLTRDDLPSLICDNDAAIAKILELCRKNCPVDVMLWELCDITGIDTLTWDEVKQVIADVQSVGKLPEVAISGDVLPEATTRAPPPTGLGCSIATGSVWVSAPALEFVMRFYRNGELMTVIENYNFTDLTTLNAVSDDVIQACLVVDGVPGWWARIVIP